MFPFNRCFVPVEKAILAISLFVIHVSLRNSVNILLLHIMNRDVLYLRSTPAMQYSKLVISSLDTMIIPLYQKKGNTKSLVKHYKFRRRIPSLHQNNIPYTQVCLL